MANRFDTGMDDYFQGKEIISDPGIEYLQGYGYAESIYDRDTREQQQVDDREQQQE